MNWRASAKSWKNSKRRKKSKLPRSRKRKKKKPPKPKRQKKKRLPKPRKPRRKRPSKPKKPPQKQRANRTKTPTDIRLRIEDAPRRHDRIRKYVCGSFLRKRSYAAASATGDRSNHTIPRAAFASTFAHLTYLPILRPAPQSSFAYADKQTPRYMPRCLHSDPIRLRRLSAVTAGSSDFAGSSDRSSLVRPAANACVWTRFVRCPSSSTPPNNRPATQ